MTVRGTHRQFKHPDKAGRVAEIGGAIRLHIEGMLEDGLAVPEPAAIAEYVEA